MAELSIELNDGRRAFYPGERLTGQARWDAPQAARLELRWTTRGRGEPDGSVLASRELERADASAACGFEFDLPPAPWSFKGNLVSLTWQLRLVLKNELETVLEIVISPTGEAVDLYHRPAV